MHPNLPSFGRRHFLQQSAALAATTALSAPLWAGSLPESTPAWLPLAAEGPNIIGPIAGYAPQVGTLVTMLNWMHDSVVRAMRQLTAADLDYLHDPKANTIGALLLHLAATEVVYQDLTFYGLKDFSAANEKAWGAAMKLGEEARKQIKGKALDYYLAQLKDVRAKTLAELKNRDDQWLMLVDPAFFGQQPTNNYCKWFHVVEHIGNHRGQITWIRKRLPGAPASGAE